MSAIKSKAFILKRDSEFKTVTMNYNYKFAVKTVLPGCYHIGHDRLVTHFDVTTRVKYDLKKIKFN